LTLLVEWRHISYLSNDFSTSFTDFLLTILGKRRIEREDGVVEGFKRNNLRNIQEIFSNGLSHRA